MSAGDSITLQIVGDLTGLLITFTLHIIKKAVKKKVPKIQRN